MAPSDSPKRLDQMDELWDMGRFPLPIYAGATGNILATIALTFFVHGRYPRSSALPAWVGLMLTLNLSPVVLLRLMMNDDEPTPIIEEMGFLGDQHKFARWVYLVASANMGFWISLSWLAFSLHRSRKVLLGTLLLAPRLHLFPSLEAHLRTRLAGALASVSTPSS